mgnify:CR=1 FL=1
MTGVLIVVCGPMFAGKTTELLRRVATWEAVRDNGPDGHDPGKGGPAAQSAIIIKPSWDKRYQRTLDAQPEVVTHDGNRRPALAAADATEVRTLLAHADPMVLIAIDEAHFFGAALVPVVLEMVGMGRCIVVCGVEIDHSGEPFEPFPTLLAQADEVVKLAARCQVCGQPARFSQRMIAHDPSTRIVIGGADLYEARCRACFVAG